MTTHADISRNDHKIDCLCRNPQPGDLYTWIPAEELTGLYMQQVVDCPRCLAISDKLVAGVTLERARNEVSALAR